MTHSRRLTSALLMLVLCAALLPATGSPATAASRYLCTGYVGCAESGHPHHGYKKASRKMWWRMYSGHNCTNYVAYRMVKGGMSAERPWSSTGMAYNWGRANRRITDDKPMVGAVAWWKRNAPGAGSSGHVAYVEKVLSRRKIIISEDSWSGDFHWRRVTKRGTGWPTGFIHFNDREVKRLARPTVRGVPAVGETLTATAGRWRPKARTRLQWLAGGKPIAGATGQRLELTPRLRRERIAVRVTATARGYVDGRATSEATQRVRKGTLEVTAAPEVTGTPRVGERLRVERGSWSPSADSVSIRWFVGKQRIAGARGPGLRVDPAWVGRRITVRTIARAEGYRVSNVRSDPSGEVRRGRFEVTEPFTLGGEATVGGRLVVTEGDYRPGAGKVTYTWLRDGRPVSGATGRRLDLRPADAGDRLAVRVVLSHPGYRDRTEVLPAGRVTTKPDVRVGAEGRRGRAVVRVRVSAPGVPDPRGPVTVRVDGREVTGKVVDGRAKLVVGDLPKGRHRVRVSYAGTDVVLPGRATTRVRVPRG